MTTEQKRIGGGTLTGQRLWNTRKHDIVIKFGQIVSEAKQNLS